MYLYCAWCSREIGTAAERVVTQKQQNIKPDGRYVKQWPRRFDYVGDLLDDEPPSGTRGP